jgi:nucleotide-binding universal stress UspA family protein
MNTSTIGEAATEAKTRVRIERILCPVDFSQCSVNAYNYAQSIAGHYGAKLLVQHTVELSLYPSAFYCPSPELFDDFRQKLIANGQDDLQKFVKASGGAQPECIVQESLAADAILLLARERAVSLIVLGTHGRRGIDRLMLGSVTERILRNASCPVLAVRQEPAGSGAPEATELPVAIRQILCCVDFSAHSERALAYALSLASAYDADLTVLHVLDGIPESANVATETDTAIENLEKLFPRSAPRSAKIHLEVRLGKAYQQILQFASDAKSDVIVAGVRGRHALDFAVFGSTIYRVIQLGSNPVLAVPI